MIFKLLFQILGPRGHTLQKEATSALALKHRSTTTYTLVYHRLKLIETLKYVPGEFIKECQNTCITREDKEPCLYLYGGPHSMESFVYQILLIPRVHSFRLSITDRNSQLAMWESTRIER